MKKDNKNGIKRIIKNNLFILKYPMKYTPFYLIISCLYAAIGEGIVFFEHTYAIKYLTDAIQYNRPFISVVCYITVIATLVALKLLFTSVFDQSIKPKAVEKLHKNMQMDLFQKAVKIDLACYDNPEYYNEFVWSISEATNRVDKSIDYLTKLCGNVTIILITGSLFIFLDKVGLIFVFATFVLSLVTNLVLTKLKYKMDVELQPKQRKRSYINRVFYLVDYAKEIRLNNINHKLKNDFHNSNKDILETINKHSKKQVLLGFLADYLFNDFILDGLYVAYLLFICVVKNAISYGSFIALHNCSLSLKSNLNSISNLLPQLQQNSLYVEKMRAFLDYEEVIKDTENSKVLPSEDCFIELKNVSFSYTENSNEILKNISLKIKPNEKIAFVGYNGAGKTTLTKMLMRLYDVSEGEILLNNVNIKDYKVEDYRNKFGAVFQDYQMFATSIAENVAMDKLQDTERSNIISALDKSGFTKKLNSLNNGIDTLLTREFNDKGVNLSGGEAQMVAIARVLAKPCKIIILDEPSSALDPISEYNLNKSILDAAKDKTVIFISHRLSSCKIADRIYMLENGRIIEEGSHEKLMELGGKYAEMFNLQAEKYRIDVQELPTPKSDSNIKVDFLN